MATLRQESRPFCHSIVFTEAGTVLKTYRLDCSCGRVWQSILRERMLAEMVEHLGYAAWPIV